MIPKEYYKNKRETIEGQINIAKRKRSVLAWVRFATILLALTAGYMAWENQQILWLIAVLAGLVGFGRALSIDVDNNAKIKRLEGLDTLIKEEYEYLTEGKPVKGSEMESINDHHYAYDLDILGKGSVYAMVNRCQSEVGRNLLANWLLTPAKADVIVQRQDAAKELAKDPDEIFALAAIGREQPLKKETVGRILQWLDQKDDPFTAKYWNVVKWAYPIITLGILAIYAAGLMQSSVFGLLFVLFLVISFSFSKRVIGHYMILSGIVKEVSVLRESINNLEGREYKAELNKVLRGDLEGASKQIKDLDSLLGRFDYRLNPYIFIFLNAFLLWDLWQMHGLTHWKEQNRGRVDKWVHALATTEALNSLALLHFNRPEWCFPEIGHQHFEFEATKLGHPLIPEAKRVTNDFKTAGLGQLELVTGSNMAGKSTFLRTVGVNIVLAMAGSPVCAESCKTSPAKVVSSMRIADNLEDSTSTFYAELKKLRSIIDMVKSKDHVFILLDEILRGTNSRDRLAGSKALVRQLIREKAVGIIATHDLELAQMEEEYPEHIHNYYFDVQFYGEQLGFDYTLRKGVCTTKNAELLMRQIGIEM